MDVILKKRLFPILEASEEEKTYFSEKNKKIDELFDAEKIGEAQKFKKNSVKRITFIFSPWVCNFTCPNYCYTKNIQKTAITTEQAIAIIQQAREMGAQATYWPGEGELTLLKNFWQIMDWQADQKIPAVLFTNGSIFHNNSLCNAVLGMKSKMLLEKLNTEYKHMHFYVKYWHSEQKKAASMVGVKENQYPYETINRKNIPLALAKLLENIDIERIGVEVMVSKENYADVKENIIPTIEEMGIYGYIEPVIFSGNAQGRQTELKLEPQQHNELAKLFASGGSYCEKRQSIELIVKGQYLTPGIAIPPREQDRIIENGVKDLFTVFHNEYFRHLRKKSLELNGCLCRAYWNKEISYKNQLF